MYIYRCYTTLYTSIILCAHISPCAGTTGRASDWLFQQKRRPGTGTPAWVVVVAGITCDGVVLETCLAEHNSPRNCDEVVMASCLAELSGCAWPNLSWPGRESITRVVAVKAINHPAGSFVGCLVGGCSGGRKG